MENEFIKLKFKDNEEYIPISSIEYISKWEDEKNGFRVYMLSIQTKHWRKSIAYENQKLRDDKCKELLQLIQKNEIKEFGLEENFYR